MDTFPSLASIPLFNMFSNWQKVGAEIHKQDSEVFLSFWNQMRKEIEAGTAPHSFGRDFVQSNYKAQGLDELDAAYTAYVPFYPSHCLFPGLLLLCALRETGLRCVRGLMTVAR